MKESCVNEVWLVCMFRGIEVLESTAKLLNFSQEQSQVRAHLEPGMCSCFVAVLPQASTRSWRIAGGSACSSMPLVFTGRKERPRTGGGGHGPSRSLSSSAIPSSGRQRNSACSSSGSAKNPVLHSGSKGEPRHRRRRCRSRAPAARLRAAFSRNKKLQLTEKTLPIPAATRFEHPNFCVGPKHSSTSSHPTAAHKSPARMDAYPVQYVLYLCICATAPASWYFRGGGGGPAGQPEAFQHNYPIRLSSSSCRRCRIEIPETTPPPPPLRQCSQHSRWWPGILQRQSVEASSDQLRDAVMLLSTLHRTDPPF